MLSYRRGPVTAAANTSGGPRTIAVGSGVELVYTTPDGCLIGTDGLQLPAFGAAIWRERQ